MELPKKKSYTGARGDDERDVLIWNQCCNAWQAALDKWPGLVMLDEDMVYRLLVLHTPEAKVLTQFGKDLIRNQAKAICAKFGQPQTIEQPACTCGISATEHCPQHGEDGKPQTPEQPKVDTVKLFELLIQWEYGEMSLDHLHCALYGQPQTIEQPRMDILKEIRDVAHKNMYEGGAIARATVMSIYSMADEALKAKPPLKPTATVDHGKVGAMVQPSLREIEETMNEAFFRSGIRQINAYDAKNIKNYAQSVKKLIESKCQ